MKRIKDQTGWITSCICFVSLFIQYCQRDAFLVSIVTFTREQNPFYNESSSRINFQSKYIEFDEGDSNLKANLNYGQNNPTNDYNEFDTYSNWLNNDNVINNVSSNDLYNENELSRSSEDWIATTENYDFTDNYEYIYSDFDESSSMKNGTGRTTRTNLDEYEVRVASEMVNDVKMNEDKFGLLREGNLVSTKQHHQQELNSVPLILVKDLMNKDKADNFSFHSINQQLRIKKIPINQIEFRLKSPWSGPIVGVALASFNWGCFFSLFFSYLLTSKVSPQILLSVSVFMNSLLGFFTELCVCGGPWAIIPLRILQGIFMGVTMNAVYSALTTTLLKHRLYQGIAFLGPTFGYISGTGLALIKQWAICYYVFSSAGVILACFPLIVKMETSKNMGKLWPKALASPSTIGCVGLYAAGSWLLQTTIAALAFCLVFYFSKPDLLWMVVILPIFYFLFAIFYQLMYGLVKGTIKKLYILCGRCKLTLIGQRRLPVFLAMVILLINLIWFIVLSLDSFSSTLVCSISGIFILVFVIIEHSVNTSLFDQSYHRFPSLILPVNMTSQLMSGFALFTVPTMVFGFEEIGNSLSDADGCFFVWIFPLVFLIPSMVFYIIFVSTKRLTTDVDSPVMGLPSQLTKREENGLENEAFNSTKSMELKSIKSFKSIRSSNKTALTFKTAMSRARSRGQSFHTVDDTVDGDIFTIADDQSFGVHSINNDTDEDMKSIYSTATNKLDDIELHSVIDADGFEKEHKFGAMLSDLVGPDTTSAWLEAHHSVQVDNINNSNININNFTKKDFHAMNIIYLPYW